MSSMVLLCLSAMKIIMHPYCEAGRLSRNLCFTDLRVGIQVSCFNGIAADGIPSCRRAIDGRTPVAAGVWQQGISSWRGVHAGTCYAWPLPADATCATVARQAFRDAVSEVGIEPDLLEDGVLMASELAANTLHAQAVAGAGGGGESARVRGRGRGGRADRVRRPGPSGSPEPPSPPGPRPPLPTASAAVPGSSGRALAVPAPASCR